MKPHLPSLFLLALALTCCQPQTEPAQNKAHPVAGLNISLAQWSLHRAFQGGTLDPKNFAAIAKNDYGITAVEYVSSFYKDHATDTAYWQQMRTTADSLGVKSLLIMIDEEGDLGSSDPEARRKAVENHHKWVDAARILGCHSIRINAFGDGSKEEVQAAMIDALKALCTYAAQSNINVLIENHGLYSSDGQWLAGIMRGVAMPNVGMLPDFGNWCTSHKWGTTQTGKPCDHAYDRYQGVSETLPFAKGVSAKSYDFGPGGEETIIDYRKMLQLVKQSGFKAYIGIEYEGERLGEAEGIRATLALLEREWVKP